MTKMRLQKFLAQAGVASRRKSEELINLGMIKINNTVTNQMGIQIDPASDIIKFKDKIITLPQEFTYYLLNKPAGYTTTCWDPYAKKTILELIPPSPRVVPVGRLDKDSRGLIILTDNGDLTNKLTHPRYEHEKEYQVIANSAKLESKEDIILNLKKIENGMILDEEMTIPTQITNINIDSNKKLVSFNIILKEGRNRQIRRMCDMINLKVISLQRIRIGKITINGLKEGQYKTLKLQDII